MRRGRRRIKAAGTERCITNRRAARLRTLVVEEFIYYVPSTEGYAMGWRRKRSERQPHLAPEQGEDDARASRKTDGYGVQEARWRETKAGGHTLPTGQHVS